MNRNIALLMLIVAFVFLLLAPLTGAAQSPCDALVIDEANVFAGDIARVRAAAQDLVNSGADVRVRTIQTFATTGNLDRFEQQLEQQCSSWTAPDGSRKNNLIVLMVSLQEQRTGLYYGSQWETALGTNWTRIQTEIMNPRFREGDFAAGFVNGLVEARRLVELQVRGGLPGTANGRTAAPDVGPRRAGGLSTGWMALIVIAIISGGVTGLVLVRSYRKNRGKRLAAQEKARLAKQEAASSVNELVQAVEMLEIKVNAMAARVAEEDSRPLAEGLEKARGLVDKGATTYSDLGRSAADPVSRRLSGTEYNAIEEEYRKLLLALQEGRTAVADVGKQVEALQQAVEQFPSRVAEVNSGIEQAVVKQEAAQAAGFKTDYPAAILTRARKSLDQATALSEKRCFLLAMQNAGEASQLVRQAIQAADELPQKKQEAEAAIPALASRLEDVKQKIDNGRRAFDRISGSYAQSSWESIRGNGTEAEKRVSWSLEALEAARVASTMEQQEWHKALDVLQQANGWLDEAESFMRSIVALEANLAAAQRDAPIEIEAARTDIRKAWDYINKYDEDIRESLEDDLREAEKQVGAAADDLRSHKPDYLNVCKLSREANESADKVLAQARDEHEAAERLRSKVASTLRGARANVSKAEEYIEDHDRDIRREAKSHLKDAQAALNAAISASDHSYALSQAQAAESAADKAYSAAVRDVTQAEESRRPVIIAGPAPWPGRGGRWPTGGASGRSGGWGSWGGGGGSSGWGGLGGGRGGGGSTGW